MKIILLFLILQIWTVSFVVAWRSYKLFYNAVEFVANKEYMDVNIHISNSTDEDTFLNAHINVLKPINDIDLHIQTLLELSENNYTTVLDRKIPYCKFLKTPSIDLTFKNLYSHFLRFGKMWKECPIQKGIYFIHEFRVDEDLLSSYLPETSFIVLLDLKMKSEDLFNGKLIGKIDKSKSFNVLKGFVQG